MQNMKLAVLMAAIFLIEMNAWSGASAQQNPPRLTRFVPKWLNQTLDHFSPNDHRVFMQKYYEQLVFFRSPDGPIFLIISGEYPSPGIDNDYITVLAKQFGAAMVSPEHRYYGDSSPFESTATENLKYLSSKQALFDLAVFRQHYQDSLNARLNRSTGTENPWFVFGGSYAGTLSAWFRLKFPHLTCGSLASSADINVVQNNTEYDKQVGESVGPECKSVLQEITHLIDQRLDDGSDAKAVKALFGAEELTNDGDFLQFLADSASGAVQYGLQDKLCIPIIEAKKARKDLVQAFVSFMDYYVGALNADVASYDQEQLKNTSLASDSATDRLWWYQVCTEIGDFQVAPPTDSIRSSKVDGKYFLDLCKNLFGEDIVLDVDATNLYYGGTRIAGSKIIFANGSQDPQRRLSKQTSSFQMPSYLITCHNCGHGVDIRGCPIVPFIRQGDSRNCSSPSAVDRVRQLISRDIGMWLSECKGCSGK